MIIKRKLYSLTGTRVLAGFNKKVLRKTPMAAKRSGNRLLDYHPIHFTRESLPLYRQGRKETERRDQPFIRYGSRSGMGLTDQLHRSKYGAGYGQSISPAVHGCTRQPATVPHRFKRTTTRMG